MSKQIQILNPAILKARPSPPVLRDPAPDPSSSTCFLPLIRKLLEFRREQQGGVIAAFTAVSRGEGVTYIIESLAYELAKHTAESILITSCSGLAGATNAHFWEPQRIQRLNRESGKHSLFRVPGRDDLDILQHKFGFVLVDSPAMQESSAVLGIAKFCSAAFLVIAAGHTSRDAVGYAQRTLQATGVPLAGLILNKRIDPIPGFLSGLL